jgi:tetratricopeptide (TPR) repeat protein
MDDHLKQLLLLAREHYDKGEFEPAESLLQKVVAQSDRFADVWDMLGVIAHARGDMKAAKAHFEKAVDLNPNYTEAQLNLMVTLNDLGEYDRARQVYSGIRSRGGSGKQLDPFAKGKIANMHAETSQAYLDAGMTMEAISELEKAVKLCPTFADLRTRLGLLYRDVGDIARAREQYEAAKEANPNYLQARNMLGVLHLTVGDASKAIEEFEAVLALDQDNKSAQTYLRIAQSGNQTPSKPPIAPPKTPPPPPRPKGRPSKPPPKP